MTRTYYYQETQEIPGTPVDDQPITVEKEIWNDGDSSHEVLTMYVDGAGYWWAYERDSGEGKRLTEEEHAAAIQNGFNI